MQFSIGTICGSILGHLTTVVPEILALEKRGGRVGSPTKSSSMFVNELSPFNSNRKNTKPV